MGRLPAERGRSHCPPSNDCSYGRRQLIVDVAACLDSAFRRQSAMVDAARGSSRAHSRKTISSGQIISHLIGTLEGFMAQREMRVLLVTPSLDQTEGGPSTSIPKYASALRNSGLSVDVLTTTNFTEKRPSNCAGGLILFPVIWRAAFRFSPGLLVWLCPTCCVTTWSMSLECLTASVASRVG